MNLGAHFTLALVWVLQWLPVSWQSALGTGLGRVLHALAGSRRRIALRNLELCMPELDAAARAALVREHFRWIGRSLLDRGLLLYASRERLMRLIEVEGDAHQGERIEGPVMWLVPHFIAVDAAATALQLCQTRRGATIYQAQSNPVFDAAVRAIRQRFGNSVLFSRHDSAKPLIRAIRQDKIGFFNLPDMDFGLKDAAFVPFFGVPAATLLAPSRMARLLDMTVLPVVVEMKEGGGWLVRCLPAWQGWPTDDALADTVQMNRWIEQEVRRLPAQYLWVHKRFKTRPEGEAGLY